MSAKIGKFYMTRLYALDNFSSFAVQIQEFESLGVGDIFFDPVFSTAEHAYQFAKFVWSDPLLCEAGGCSITASGVRGKIYSARSAHEAKQIADKNFIHVRADWKILKFHVMEEILNAKFNQHSYVRKTLAKAFGQELVENSPDDNYWGIAWRQGGRGMNNLGEIWMKIQRDNEDILRAEFPDDFGIFLQDRG